MPSSCQAGFSVEKLRERVRCEYDRVARDPKGNFHFQRGPAYAARSLGYDPDEVATIPAESAAAFTGVGNPLRIGPIAPGESIIDIGCGAGMDLLLATRRAGPTGRVIGIDMTPAMIELAKRAAVKAGVWNHIEIRRGIAEDLPVESESIDVAISNGVLNLSPDKLAAYREIYRVLRPGGRLYLADVIVHGDLPAEIRSDIDLWAA